MPKVIKDMTALTRAIEELWSEHPNGSDADSVYDAVCSKFYRLAPEVTETLVCAALYSLVQKIGDSLDDMGSLYAELARRERRPRRSLRN